MIRDWERLRARVPCPAPRVVLPDGADVRVVEAALRMAAAGIARPLLLGGSGVLERVGETCGIDAAGVEARPVEAVVRSEHVERYSAEHRVGPSEAERVLRHPTVAAAALVRAGEAETMLAGAAATTAEVLVACETVLGRDPAATTTSSFFLMETTDGRSFLFADCAIHPEPDAAHLAAIAVQTAHSAELLLGVEPRVALLSFSTRGSADHPAVDKVREATAIARRAAPDFLFEGEIQADAAVDSVIARHKLAEVGPVAGQANVLIFPNLDAGNIAYKLVRSLGGAAAVGTVLQGYRAPVSDVSRGVHVSEVVDAALLLAVLCRNTVADPVGR